MQTSGVLLMLGLTVALAARLPAADSLPLQSIGPCRFQETPWADGDSFRVILPDGQEETVRLYGVDCLECNVTGDDSNARRLRDQRRWFGILDISVAKGLGIAAKEKTAELLSRPFHIHTAFADGRGDPQYRRYYAFVTLEDGRDLSETLVQLGLARAFGVSRQRPDGTSAEEWKQRLADLELLASRKGTGAWAFTDWDRLPEERKQLRAEEAELAVAKGAAKLAEGMTINLNTASRDELLMLKGIGDVRANAIIENRPFGQVDDLVQVPGIGLATLEALRPFLRIEDLDDADAGP